MQFDDAEQQHEAAALGMWAFLATEILFFGGVLTGFVIYRHRYLEAFAEGGKELWPWIGTANTAVLLLSSFAMAMAVHEAETQGRRKHIARYLLLTALLGATFICVKAVEYTIDWHEGLIPSLNWHPEHLSHPDQTQMFFFFYFFLTILHAIHMTAGIGVILIVAWQTRRPDFSSEKKTTVEMLGLYWHFVDVVWIFLFPLLYLTA